MIDMLAFLGRRSIKDGPHHVPADGLGVEGVVVPHDDTILTFQQLEGGFGVFLHAFVVVVAVDEDHVVFAEMGCEVKGLGVAVELFHIGQIFAEKTVQVGVLLVASQLHDVFFRQVEGDTMLCHLGQIRHTLTTPCANFEVILYRIAFRQGPQQGDVDRHSGTRKVGVGLRDFVEIGEQFVDFDDGQTVDEVIFADDVFLVAAFVLKDEVEQVRMSDDAPDGFGQFIEFIHFQRVVSRIVVSVRRCSSVSRSWSG